MTVADDRLRALLMEQLAGRREHVLATVEGMAETELRRALLPSGWTPLAMINHLIFDVERFWFQAVLAADPTAIERVEASGRADAWQVDDVPAETVLAEYRGACAEADVIIAGTALDAPPAWWPGELFGDWRMHDLAQIVLHVITETAIHSGHLDAWRELADGHQRLVLT